MFRRKPPTPVSVEWIIVGLGNPGGEYRGTRHNVGFEAVELLATRHHMKLNKARHRAMMALGDLDGHAIALVKPLTYMNLSGQSVAPIARELNVKPDKILVVADDLDLPVGKVKMKLKGSSGGHNGHKSLIAALRTDEYPRVKIGIGKVEKEETVDHVLGPFSLEERVDMNATIVLTAQVCEAVIRDGWEAGLRVLERATQAR